MRAHGAGALYQRPNGYWVGAYISRRDRKRRSVCGWIREEVERRLDDAVALSRRQRSNDRLFYHSRQARCRLWVEDVLSRARNEQWDDMLTARVVVAQLSPRRIRADVFGPCVYCGRWDAGTVDHRIPTSRGGTNLPDNLVSACHSCNSRKGARELPRATSADVLPRGLLSENVA